MARRSRGMTVLVSTAERPDPGRRRAAAGSPSPSAARWPTIRASSPSPRTTSASSRRPIDRAVFQRTSGALDNTGQTLDGTTSGTGIADVDIDGLEALRISLGHPERGRRRHRRRGRLQPPRPRGARLDEPGRGRREATTASTTTATATSTTSTAGTSATTTTRSTIASTDGHGTHVAGTIAASLNGNGVVGVAPGIRIMALKFIEDNDGCGMDDQAIAAIDYAAIVRRADHQRVVGRRRTRARCSTPRSRTRGRCSSPRPATAARTSTRPAVPASTRPRRPCRTSSSVAAVDQRGGARRSRTTARRASTSRRRARTS